MANTNSVTTDRKRSEKYKLNQNTHALTDANHGQPSHPPLPRLPSPPPLRPFILPLQSVPLVPARVSPSVLP